jgi:hypothetical protein
MKPFSDSIMDSLDHFKSHGYMENLESQITSESLPPEHQDLLAFLLDQVIHI